MEEELSTLPTFSSITLLAVCCLPSSAKKSWELERWGSDPPQAYSLFGGDRVSVKEF